MSIAPAPNISLEELLASDDAGRYEIVNGQLVEVHVSNLSVDVGTEITTRLRNHCRATNVGRAFGADMYYKCFPDEDETRSRKPDASFVSRERLPIDWIDRNHLAIPPDLTVEVISPRDLAYEVRRKIAEYLAAGVRMVWEIYPEDQLALVYRPHQPPREVHAQEILSGEDVVPGFECRLAELFPSSS